MSVDLGLNVFQVIQNELITREASRSTLGTGFRLAIIEERIKNAEAINRNGQVWRLNHAVHRVTCLTPGSRRKAEQQKEKLMSRRDAKQGKDDKDPTMMVRDVEDWECHDYYPKTVLQFKQLQFHPKRVRALLEFYDIRVYRPDLKPVKLDHGDHCRDVEANLEVCMEEIAITWGINFYRIGGLALPPPNGFVQHVNHSPSSSSVNMPPSTVRPASTM